MKILVIGDAMTDLYWRGDISRISPEAPVPIFSAKQVEKREGAAANVANNIEAMGVQCERLFGAGERIKKIRLLARGQHFARVDFDSPQTPITPLGAYEDALGRCEIVVMLDYGKGSLDGVQALISEARAKGRLVLIDPKGHDYAKYRGASLIKPNREEMRELVGGWVSQEELDFKARQFLLASGIDSILLTQAGEGMTLYTKTQTAHFKAEAKEVVDVSGAGETALSAYAAAMAKGYQGPDCAEFANKAAGIAVGRFGTVVVTEQEVFG